MTFAGARSGGKGVPVKKTKKKKRDFHTAKRKARTEGGEVIDLEGEKARVLEGLTHLGQQKFTPEPGGYSLTNWLKGLNFLLDDFESKVNGEALPPGYSSKREEVTARFSSGVDTSQIEAEMTAIRKEESEIRATFEREREKAVARLVALRLEKEGKRKEIEKEKASLEEIRAKRKSASIFAKLAGRSGPPTEPAEQRIGDLEKEAKALDDEEVGLQKIRASIEREGGTASGPFADQWNRLDAMGARLKELDGEIQVKSQLAKEREEAMGELAQVIMKFDPKASTEMR